MATKTELQNAQSNTQVATRVNDKFITQMIQQIKEKQELGLTFPTRYNPANELMGAYLILKEAVDANKKPVLEVCSTESIATSLMKMVNAHLSALNGQCYLIPYGGKLQCQPSVFGNEANAKDCGMKDINSEIIYEGDIFEYHIEDGVKIIDVHKQNFENIDLAKIKGAYAVAIMQDGTKKAEIMNFEQIKTAWKQGFGYKEGGNGTHQKFTDQMCKKTVENRAMKHIIRGGGNAELNAAYDDFERHEADDRTAMDVEYEIKENANTVPFDDAEVETVTGEVVEETATTEQPLPDFMSAE